MKMCIRASASLPLRVECLPDPTDPREKARNPFALRHPSYFHNVLQGCFGRTTKFAGVRYLALVVPGRQIVKDRAEAILTEMEMDVQRIYRCQPCVFNQIINHASICTTSRFTPAKTTQDQVRRVIFTTKV
jgi:hypothetical protein